MSEQIEITDCVKYLVFDEFIAVTQAVAVQHAVFIKHDGIIQTAAQRQPVLAQPLDLLHEAEGTRTRHFANIRVFCKINGHFLPGSVNRRVVEDNRERQSETIVRIKARPFFACTIRLAHFADA